MNEENFTADDSYESKWRQLRKQYKTAWIMFLGYIPIAGGIGLSLSTLFHSDTPFLIVCGGWLVAMMVYGNIMLKFECPRCGKRFFCARFYHNGYALRCVHCKLPKWASHDPD